MAIIARIIAASFDPKRFFSLSSSSSLTKIARSIFNVLIGETLQ